MPAPNKQGMDYFRHSTGLIRDRKLREAKMKYGAAATVVYLSLLELIYADKGYYIQYDDNLVWDVMENLQGKYCPDAETVREIVECLVASGLFSGDQFKRKILTSKRVQQEFYSVTVARKAVDVDFSIWLLSESEMRAMSGKSVVLLNYINRLNNGVIRPNNPINQSNNSQSRVEKRRVEKSRVEGGTSPEEDEIYAWIASLPLNLPPKSIMELIDFLDQADRSLIEWAVKEAADRGKPWSYARAIIADKLVKGIRSANQLLPSARGRAVRRSYDAGEMDRAGLTLPDQAKLEESL